MRHLITLYVFCSLCLRALLAQTTWYVATNGLDNNDPGRGESWTLPFLTISNGVAHALTAGDLVMVSNGVYTNLAELIVSRDITLKSANGAAVTVIDGNHPAITNRCVQVKSRGAIVDGFTICYGYAPIGMGGGLYINKGGTVVNCHIVSNQAGTGSGYGGGGVMIESTGMVANCVIAWNECITGGGVTFRDGTTNALLVNCKIEHNRTTTQHGAGICFSGGAPGGIARSCLVRYNRAVTAGSGGGAVMHWVGLLENCTIVSNSCTNGYGGGVWMRSGSAGTAAVVNCVIYSNEAKSAATTMQNYNVDPVGIFSNSCFYPSLPAASEAVSGNNTTNNPVFACFAESDYRLLPDSPCVNTGMLRPWMPGTEMDGHAMPDRFSGLPDMGCYELVRQGVMFKFK